jgi:flagellar basal body rod protein FlgG
MDGIAWSASAMVAARTRLEIATDNLANASSQGFHAVFARGRLDASGVTVERVRGDGTGALRATGEPFDLAVAGGGAFLVRDGSGRTSSTRDGAFVRAANGTLRDLRGRTLLGTSGTLRVPPDARIDDRGVVTARDGRAAGTIAMTGGGSVRQGFLETSGVDPIAEMIDVLRAQRSFESAQKVYAALDRTRDKSANEVARTH